MSRMESKMYAYRIFVGMPHRKYRLGRPRKDGITLGGYLSDMLGGSGCRSCLMSGFGISAFKSSDTATNFSQLDIWAVPSFLTCLFLVLVQTVR